MAPQPQFHKFRLKSETMAVVVEAEKSTIIRLPPGATVTVLDGLNDSTEPNRQVEVEWQGKSFKMFAVDILARGEKR